VRSLAVAFRNTPDWSKISLTGFVIPSILCLCQIEGLFSTVAVRVVCEILLPKIYQLFQFDIPKRADVERISCQLVNDYRQEGRD
jgi:hypothetical protein